MTNTSTVFIVQVIAGCYRYSHKAKRREGRTVTVQEIRRKNVEILVAQFGSQGKFANKVETAPNYVSQIVTGKRDVGTNLARKIEKAVGLTMGAMDVPNLGASEALALADDRPYPAMAPLQVWENRDEIDREENIMVPMLSGQLAAGDGVDISEYIKCTMPFRAGTLRDKGVDPACAYMVEIRGNSMEPRMFDGDYVVVDISDKTVREGKVYAIRDGKLLRVKILIPQGGGGVVIRSLNTADYPDEVLSGEEAEERIEVIGRVFHLESMAF